MSDEWPSIGRGSRAGKPPTEEQEKIIEFVRSMARGPFGEPSTHQEIRTEFPELAVAECPSISTNSQLDMELYDCVNAGWLKCYPGESYDPWERPRPERTDLPVEDRQAASDGHWTDSNGTKHYGSMAFEGDPAAVEQIMQAIG